MVKGYQKQFWGAPLGKRKETGNGKGEGKEALADPVVFTVSQGHSLILGMDLFFVKFVSSAGPKGLDFSSLGP